MDLLIGHLIEVRSGGKAFVAILQEVSVDYDLSGDIKLVGLTLRNPTLGLILKAPPAPEPQSKSKPTRNAPRKLLLQPDTTTPPAP